MGPIVYFIEGGQPIKKKPSLESNGLTLGAQSFTPLMEDLRQEINRVSSFSTVAGALMQHFLDGSAPLRLW